MKWLQPLFARLWSGLIYMIVSAFRLLQSLLKALLQALSTSLRWLFRRLRPGRRVFRFSLIVCLVWAGVVIWLTRTIYTFGEDDQAQSADVIIVLGSGLRRDNSPGDALWRRGRKAAQLYTDGYAPFILCTGGTTPGYSRSEAQGCRQVLTELGVPELVIVLEENSRSTEENALNAHEIMEERGWKDAVLVTDSFHMLRANWIFDTQGIIHYPSAAPSEWVSRRWYFQFTTRELIALHWQLVKEVLNLPVTYVPFG